jgi:hypothetical protein
VQSVFSAVFPEFDKARRVSRELIYVIRAAVVFISRVELAYACKKCVSKSFSILLLSPSTFMPRKKYCRKLII